MHQVHQKRLQFQLDAVVFLATSAAPLTLAPHCIFGQFRTCKFPDAQSLTYKMRCHSEIQINIENLNSMQAINRDDGPTYTRNLLGSDSNLWARDPENRKQNF